VEGLVVMLPLNYQVPLSFIVLGNSLVEGHYTLKIKFDPWFVGCNGMLSHFYTIFFAQSCELFTYISWP
jgi:hypothetical protein